MKKVLSGVALLLVLNALHATPLVKHSEPRNILSSELPAALQSEIRTAYAGYWITELTEEGKDKHTRYQLTLENADQVVILKAEKEENWSVVSTIVKA